MRTLNLKQQSIIACVAILSFFSLGVSAQTATLTTNGPSPMINIDGTSYQTFCVEYNNNTPQAGHGYNWDNTPEDITNDDIISCLAAQGSYSISAIQAAVWYFSDNINPSSGSNAWNIINSVNNGTYQPQCCSEWYPNDNSYQDVISRDDPYCVPTCDPALTIYNNGT
ncbi:MAG: hypothetical protein HKN51_05570, partial [Saprospiraceae bacterium]|nr:hypothetical protein [Saprospiraceae bacterium]